MSHLISQVSYPYKLVRGSFGQRQNASIHLVDKLYKSLLPQFKHGNLPVDKLQKTIDHLTQKQVKILVKNNYDMLTDGGSDIIYSPISDSITATTLEIPIKNKKVSIKDLVTIMHEFQHLADQIFHPKYLQRNQFLYQNNMYSDKYNKLYDDFVYNEENINGKKIRKHNIKHLEHKIRQFLRRMPTEDKVNFLQDTRYTLMMEEQAYHTQYKYAKKLNKKHLPVNDDDLKKLNAKYMFAEKIELLKRLTFEIIKKERELHALKMKKVKKSKD